jgi:bacteriocin-like protein
LAQRRIEQEEAIVTKSNQLSTSKQGSLDKSAETGEKVSPELTEDELNKVSGGMRRSGAGTASSGFTFLRFD